jgi:hypothetical protein
MIAAEIETGELIIFVVDEPIEDARVASLKGEFPGAMILADLLEPLYESSISTRDAAHLLGRIKSELHSKVKQGARVVVICRSRTDDLGTRSHFVASLCASADRVHFLKRT